MKALYKCTFFLLLLCLPLVSQGQKKKSKAQLEKEKKENLSRIKEANRILQQTKKQKEVSIGQLNAIKEKITVQKGVINNISREINFIESDVQETEGIVGALQNDLEKLKAEYATMVYAASKTANSYNKLMFLFASDSFNQLVRRLRYLQQYSEARKKQVEQINKVQAALTGQLALLESKKKQKENLLAKQVQESKNLHNLKQQQDSVITTLSKQEADLKQEVAARQQAVKKLDKLIADIVREEIARAARAARAAGKASSASAGKVTLTPEAALISSSFAGNKGRLGWPVERGFVSQKFGRHNHPVLKGVVVENRGIDIQTSQGAAARAIFEGKVLTVASVPGMNNIVMVQHGEYFTVYAKLKSVSVSTGQTVKLNDTIGTIYTDSDGTTELQFQIWKNQQNLNPETWISHK
ncbi:septal ring factor EnvC (AmiA/AmiB activator) [Pontibacter ummariensis]|uniref:Septal ring factor EnvC, activator of murein hydrolases AmiA and AmiB n=1 Tax=Pontibacter ummariensis TaxID=1610492 RepID=A0A239HTP9_9BACT|nr:peptidoglycan DD-metalloendopeptidase family protein [Pontibacter ummariensis]PRY10424.1 septal ring factor EnvC (AmiA/AmiB activator) [Pontibacter ummariensis]SNS84478.1 Septal ring factor EnvC, activator of murein hydrolases AmiA and AmiB [Pontibacter ummariensis]